MKSTNILTTTTSTIEGYKIEQYLQTVSSHIVLGTNVFSDFAASFTDFFGGQSTTYENKLKEIYNKALDSIKRETQKIGGNCIIGLKFDFDQISSKGTGMFMVTAVGTAAIVSSIKNGEKTNSNKDKKYVNGSEIDKEIKKNQIKRELLENPKNPFEDNNWNFIIENNISEICFDLILCCTEWYKTTVVDKANYCLEKVKQYLYSLPDEDAKTLLYSMYLDEKYSTFENTIFNVIKSRSILDNRRILSELQKIDSGDKLRYKLLALLTVRDERIDVDDLADYKALLECIESKFPILASFGKQKKLFSSTEIDVWICTCKRQNEMNVENCFECLKDMYGFYNGKVNPPKAKEWLLNTINYLESFQA